MGESPGSHGILLGGSMRFGAASNIRRTYGQPVAGSLFASQGATAPGFSGRTLGWIAASRRHRRRGKYLDRKSTRLNSRHLGITYAGLWLKKNRRLAAAAAPVFPPLPPPLLLAFLSTF